MKSFILIVLAIIAFIVWKIVKDFRRSLNAPAPNAPAPLKSDIVISKYFTYLVGIAFCAFLAWIVMSVIAHYVGVYIANSEGTWYMSMLKYAIFFTSLGIAYALFFHGRLQNIEVSNHGVIFFLGAPLRGRFVLGMGLNWVLPFLTSVRQVDVSEQIQNIPLTATEDGFEATTLQSSSAQGTGGKLTLLVRLAIRWKVFNSRQYVIFNAEKTDVILGGKAWDGIRNKSIDAIRQVAATKDDETFVSSKVLIASGITDIINIVSQGSWGIRIIEVVIPKAEPKNPAVKAARENEFIEKNERAGEVTENEHVLALIGKTKVALKAAGMTDDNEATLEAIRIVKVERGKAQEIYVGGNAGDFARGAAISAQHRP